MMRLSGKMAETAANRAGLSKDDSAVVRFVRNMDMESLEHPFLQVLSDRFAHTSISGMNHGRYVEFEANPVQTSVTYVNVGGSALFGSSRLERRIAVDMSIAVTQRPGGKVLFADILSEENRDTIEAEWTDRLENPALRFTRGDRPSGSLFENIVEPLVILSSAAVLVYLLFTVRS
jgi:hypothetical protein